MIPSPVSRPAVRAGKIRHYGVSNLDLDEMKELWSPRAGRRCRPINSSTTFPRAISNGTCCPGCGSHRVPTMAVFPDRTGPAVVGSRLVGSPSVTVSPRRRQACLVACPGGYHRHPEDEQPGAAEGEFNALKISLTPAQLAELDRLFPPPTGPHPLEML